MRKLKLKALARKIEAAEAGHLLPHELSAKLRNDVKEVAKRRAVNDKRIEKRHVLSKLAVRARTIRLRDTSVYAAPCVTGDILNKVQHAARQHSMVWSAISDSCVLVVNDISNPPLLVRLYAMMKGRRICSPSLVMNSGSGPSHLYEAANSIKRWIWITPAFRAHHRDFSTALVDCARANRSKWVQLSSERDYISKALQFSAPQRTYRRPMAAIAVCRVEEMAQAAWGSLAGTFTMQSFMAFISKPNAQGSTIGTCGR